MISNNSPGLCQALNAAERHGPVFPCKGKVPLTSNGFYSASDDPKVVKLLWQEHRDANIAMRTGVTRVVVDVDGPEGEAYFATVDVPKDTLVARTGRDGTGLHYHYNVDPDHGIGCTSKRQLEIDIRGDGGYVMLPPSVHPDTGRTYEWVDESVPVVHLTPEQAEVLRNLAPAKEAVQHIVSDLEPAPPLDEIPVNSEIRQSIREGAANGARSEALAAAYRALSKAKLTVGQIASVLMDPAHGLGEKPREKGLDWLLGDIARLLDMPERRGNFTLKDCEISMEAVPKAANESAKKPSFEELCKKGKLTLRGGTLDGLMQKEIPELKWQVDGFLPDGFHLLAAVPKKGKSYFVYQLAIAKATGGKAFGGFSCKNSEKPEVLMLALEDGERRLQERFNQLTDHGRPPKGLHYSLDWPPLDDGGLDLLDAWLRDHPKTGLVSIDLLTNLIGQENPGKSQYREDYRLHVSLTRLADRHKIAILGVTHSREMAAADAIDKVFGSRGVSGSVDSTFVMEGDRFEPECKIARIGRDAEDKVYNFRRDGVRWIYDGEAESEASELQRQILEVLAIRKRPTLPSEIAEALEANAATVRQNLRRMLNREKVEQPVPGRYIKARSLSERIA